MAVLRAALTQTRNAYSPMPASVDELPSLRARLDAVRDANVEHHVALIAAAAERGCRLIGLGELFTAPYFALRRDAFWRDFAEDAVAGPTVTAMRAAAARQGVVIVAPIYERAGDRRFNTAVVIDADGRRLGSYRKLHIPQGGNEQGGFDEKFYYERGDGRQNEGLSGMLGDNRYLPVFDTAAGRVGVAICYDRHFEGVMSELARAGAQVVLSPAVTFGAKSRRMWDVEFQVDAARHRLFIGGSNRIGAEPPWDQRYFGASHFVGPEGRLEDRSDREDLVISDLDLDALAGADPSGWDLQRDARREIRGEGRAE